MKVPEIEACEPGLIPDGGAIALLRERKRVSTSQLALHIGVSRQHLGRIQRGERGASRELLQKIADALGKPIEEIARKEGPR